MPLYEYRCEWCGGVFEKIVLGPETEPGRLCPRCQSQDKHKKLSQNLPTGAPIAFGQAPQGGSPECESAPGTGHSGRRFR